MTAQARDDVQRQRRSAGLWAGIIGVPVIWAIVFETNYALVPRLCKSHAYITLHLISAVGLLLALIGAILSWRDFAGAGRGSPDQTDGGPVARTRFLGALGAATALLFAMLIAAQGIAAFFMDACWH